MGKRIFDNMQLLLWLRSCQVWEHAPKQRVAAPTFRRYSRGLGLPIPQTDAWVGPLASSTRKVPSLRESDKQDQSGKRATGPDSRS